jgi:hypothetical protein
MCALFNEYFPLLKGQKVDSEFYCEDEAKVQGPFWKHCATFRLNCLSKIASFFIGVHVIPMCPEYDKFTWGSVDWIGLPRDRDKWRTVVDSVMNLRVP